MTGEHDQPKRPQVVIYPGHFDPVHYGHLDVARRAAAIFDHVIVAVYELRDKPILFTVEERVELFRVGLADVPNVEVAPYRGLTVEYARERGASVIVRGLRATSDFEYEYQMYTMNRHLEPSVDTVFMMTSLRYAYLSASLIKDVASLGAPLDGLVPDHVARALEARLRREGGKPRTGA